MTGEAVSTLALVIGILVGLAWRPGASFPVKEMTAEQAAIALDFLRRPERLVRIVGELDGRAPIRVGDLAHERDRLAFPALRNPQLGPQK